MIMLTKYYEVNGNVCLWSDESAKPGAVVDAVASLCETRSRHVEEHLASLFQTDDITRYNNNIIIIIIIITSTIYNWRRNTAMPLQGRLTVN